MRKTAKSGFYRRKDGGYLSNCVEQCPCRTLSVWSTVLVEHCPWEHCPCAALYLGNTVLGEHCPCGALSLWSTVLGEHCPWGTLSLWNTLLGKHCPCGALPLGTLSLWSTVLVEHCPWGAVSLWTTARLEKPAPLRLVKQFPHFVEPEGSFPCSQEPITYPYSKPEQPTQRP